MVFAGHQSLLFTHSHSFLPPCINYILPNLLKNSSFKDLGPAACKEKGHAGQILPLDKTGSCPHFRHRQEEHGREKGRRGEGTRVGWRVLLSAQFWLWLAKRGSLDKSLNLSLPQNPVCGMRTPTVMLHHLSPGWVVGIEKAWLEGMLRARAQGQGFPFPCCTIKT